jgi:hypothetical protein
VENIRELCSDPDDRTKDEAKEAGIPSQKPQLSSNPACEDMHTRSFSSKTRSLLYVGNFRIWKHVEALGSFSPSLDMPMRWTVKGGANKANPPPGPRGQLVTNRRKAACSEGEKEANTLHSRLTCLSADV